MGELGQWIKEGNHKWLLAGGIVAFIVIWYVVGRSSGGSAASSGSDYSALYGQELQASEQQQAQDTQIQGQLDLAQVQAQTTQQANSLGAQVQLAQTGAQYYLGMDQTAAQIQESNNTLSATTAGLADQLAGLESNNATTADIAQISADEQLGIANINGQTELGISNNATQLGIVQSDNTAGIAKTYANAGTTNAAISAGGNIIGSLIRGIL